MSTRVGILGAGGFVGKHLNAALVARNDEVRAHTLRDPAAAAAALMDCDVIVNLAGEPVAQRWTPDVKRRIAESRTLLPRSFLHELRALRATRPQRYISASAIGYYGTSETATFTEESAPGDDFLARVCVDWEREALAATDLGMRAACIRTGFALGSGGGALARILPIFKAGAGGRVGSGQQWCSWVHIEDVVGIYLMAIDGADGALNAVAPNAVRNLELTRALGKVLHRPTIFPVPYPALKIVLGEGAYIATQGQRVMPQRTLACGYRFKFTELENALEDLL
ncbi:MAG: TIGR01777 family oxidoreductase [Candidatus Eremiobacteraeota bacterium]|nr:TIGR01777 family oxidoreductase [Candidatus Eremiobacteraeota bacterium]